jgi:hypothetical protein
MPELAPKTTAAAAEDVAAAFKTAAEAADITPTAPLLGVLLAQSALETGHWSAMYCWNFGNVKATDKWIAGGGSYTFYDKKPPHAEAPVTENLSPAAKDYWLAQAKPRTDGGEGLDMVVGHQRADGRFYCLFWPSHEQARFRAFESLEAGAAAFLSKLTGRYKAALTPAAAGNVAGYVGTIHSLGYFTAGLQTYTNSVQALYRRYLPIAKAAMAGPFEHLSDTDVLTSRPGDVELADSGWLELESGAKISRLPVWDKANDLFARLGWQAADAWLQGAGLRLPTAAELEELFRAALHIEPYCMVFAATDHHHMRSHRWCATHDAEVLARLEAAGWDGEPVANAGKHWCAPAGAIYGWWYESGRRIQNLSRFHAGVPTYTDYATTVHAVQDAESDVTAGDGDVLDSIDPGELDPDLSHGERAVAWALARVGTAEQPLGSNRGPEVSAWLKPCQRDGYGPEFGAYLATVGANWCAAFACAAHAATRLREDPPLVTAYRCSGIELQNDAKASGAWRDIALVRSGNWAPRAGDHAIYKSGSQAWRRHVVVVAEVGPESFRGIGGNEGNKVTDLGGRRYDHPQLLGFVELPRVEELAGDWEPLRRAVELDRDLWQGVVGMGAFDELLAELQEADPRDDGEEVLC